MRTAAATRKKARAKRLISPATAVGYGLIILHWESIRITRTVALHDLSPEWAETRRCTRPLHACRPAGAFSPTRGKTRWRTQRVFSHLGNNRARAEGIPNRVSYLD